MLDSTVSAALFCAEFSAVLGSGFTAALGSGLPGAICAASSAALGSIVDCVSAIGLSVPDLAPAIAMPAAEPVVIDPVRNFSDFIIIGLTMNIVGTFFLANSIVFKRPRRVIEEFFVSRPGSLLEIRDYIFTKIQVIIGFVFIFCGFGLQIVAHVDKLADPTRFLIFAIAAIFTTAFLVGTIGYATSRRAFKRYLKDFFRKNPWPFARNMMLTQEIGEIFGIPKNPEDTVEMYCAKLRRELRVPEGSEFERGGEGPRGSSVRNSRSE